MNLDQLPVIDEKWKDRRVSNAIKWMMREGKRSTSDVAKALGISCQAFKNKLNRNTFSFYELLIISKICGVDIEFIGPVERQWSSYDYYEGPYDEENYD